LSVISKNSKNKNNSNKNKNSKNNSNYERREKREIVFLCLSFPRKRESILFLLLLITDN